MGVFNVIKIFVHKKKGATMRKKSFFIKLFVTLFIIAALSTSVCGNVLAKNNGNNVTVASQTVVNQDGVAINVTGLNANGFFGSELKLSITNGSNYNIVVQARDMSVNDVMIDPIFSQDVAIGKSANSEVALMTSSLQQAGIKTIQKIETKFVVIDKDSWTELFVSPISVINTSAAGTFTQTYNTAGTVLLDNGAFKVIAQKIDSKNSFWGADIYMYIENNTNQDITVQAHDVSVNGFMVDPIFSQDVCAGKKAFSTITFLDSDLQKNGITTITTMDLKLYIFDPATVNTIMETAVITVPFQ